MGISSALGDAIVPTSYGFRNVIINGNFSINQRVYTSGSNLASGSYGFDRWKSNYTNTALTFTSAPQGQTVTISASGVIRQVVERANVAAGNYILSWSGTATGRVYNNGASAPSYSSSPVAVYLDGSADVIVEFTPSSGTATLGEVQLEMSHRQTPFERRPVGTELELCYRYFFRIVNGRYPGVGVGANVGRLGLIFPREMRIAPTMSGGSFYCYDGFGVFAVTIGAKYISKWAAEWDATTFSGSTSTGRAVVMYNNNDGTALTFSSEL